MELKLAKALVKAVESIDGTIKLKPNYSGHNTHTCGKAAIVVMSTNYLLKSILESISVNGKDSELVKTLTGMDIDRFKYDSLGHNTVIY